MTPDSDFERNRLRTLLVEAGLDPENASPSHTALTTALDAVERLKQENARLRQDAARTAGNYRLALSFGQAKLAASEAELDRFEAILQSAIDFAIIVMDLDGVVRTWNAGATRILGWSADEIEGQHARLFFTPEDRESGVAETEFTRSIVNDRANDERWHIRKSGERFFAMGTMMPLRRDDGATIGFLKILRDETQRRLAEQRVSDGAYRLRTILDTVPIGILIADSSGKIIDGNQRVAEVLKHPAFREGNDVAARWVGFHADGRRVAKDEYPLHVVLKTGVARASLEVDYQKGDGTRGWVRFEAASTQNEAGATTGVVVAITDIDARKKAEAQQRFLMNELSHRVKNILAVVVSIARQTLRSAETLEDASTALLSRITALAGAHDVLMQQQWVSADMMTLVAGAMKVQDAGRQVAIKGPDVRLGPQAALSLALVLHELGTNAVKYGALSNPGGRVDIDWSRENEADDPHLVFCWREAGGPPVNEPGRTGFGSRLIKHSLSSFGTVAMDYAPAGFSLDFRASIKRIAQVDHV